MTQPIEKTLGLFGLGAFGQLMVQHLAPYVTIVAYDPSPDAQYYAAANKVRIAAPEEVAKSDIVVLAVPVPRMESVLHQIKDHVREGAIVMDVGSLKMKPTGWMDAILPPHVDILGTHPLFGPSGASKGTKGLRLVLCPVRGPSVQDRAARLRAFVEETFGLSVIMATPEEHDREMAYVQGLPHMISKILINMEPLPRRMMTPNYNLFMQSVDVVRKDTDDLFRTIICDNPYAAEVRNLFFEEARKFLARLEGENK